MHREESVLDDHVVTPLEPHQRAELLRQLDRLVTSKHFRNSRRYPMLLRYVVEQTLAGHADLLKERTLGMTVFERPSDYDTNADPIVRVTAGEVRKRIAQYYQEREHQDEVRIDLPLGSYIPRFEFPGRAGSPRTGEQDGAERELLPAVEPTSAHAVAVNDPTADPLRGGHHEPAMAGSHDHAHDGHAWAAPLSAESHPAPGHQVAGHQDAGLGTSRRPLSRAVLLWMVLCACLPAAAVLLAWRYEASHPMPRPTALWWQPMLAAGEPIHVVVGVHSLDASGDDMPVTTHPDTQDPTMLGAMLHSNMVPISDVEAYSHVTDLLTRQGRSYITRGSDEVALDEIRQGPVVLVGGLDNAWTMWLTSGLRYHFYARDKHSSSIVDAKQPGVQWSFDNMQHTVGRSHDYAIVASFDQPAIAQHVLVVAGIGMAGTRAATEFVTSDAEMRAWFDAEHPVGKNIELVLETEIVDGQAGPPRVIAKAVW
jgi:hypothetical protein